MKPWKRILWAATAVLSLLLLLLLWQGDRAKIQELTPQLAAERWETAEKPYAMASVFLEEKNAIPQEAMTEIRMGVERALTAGSVPSEDHPWLHAASVRCDGTLQNENNSANVELTAVAGDFFEIHPMVLLSGWYMNEADVMHDRIVLDRQAAWDLFSSDNVAGMYLSVNGIRYQVAAVVDTEPGRFNGLAAESASRAWVFGDSPATQGMGYTTVEMVLPQPVEQFAAATMKTALGNFIPEKTVITDNSGRFSLKNRWDVLRTIGVRSISSSAVAYPYWENAARLTENHLALRLVPEFFLLLYPAVSLIIVLIWLNNKRTWGLWTIRYAVEDAIDRKHRREYEACQRGQVPKKKRIRLTGGRKVRKPGSRGK